MYVFFSKKESPSGGGEHRSLAVDPVSCPQNHPCPAVRVCPVGALTQKGYKAPEVDPEKCIACGKCVRYCPMRALSLT